MHHRKRKVGQTFKPNITSAGPGIKSNIIKALKTTRTRFICVHSGKSNLRSRPEGVADFLVSKLTGWVVSFYVGSGDWACQAEKVTQPEQCLDIP
eukprot:1152349-Pelagomonas_calceolata.AAC.3